MKLEEIKKIIVEEIAKVQPRCQERMSVLIDKSIEKRVQHVEPSKDTLKFFEELKKRDDEQDEKFTLMYTKVDEMHSFFTGAKFLQKSIIWIFTTAGIVAGGVLAIREVFRK